MDDDLFSDSGSRSVRRRERRARVRRRRIIALVAVLVAAGAVAGAVLAAGGGRAADTGGGRSGGEPAQAAASPAAGTSASPSPSPTSTPAPPPLTRPTTRHPLHVYFGGDSLAGLPGELLVQLGRKNDLMEVRTDYQVSSRLTSPTPVDWAKHLDAVLKARRPDVAVFMIGINDPGMPMTVKGSFTMYPQKAWLDEYRRRAERLMRTMLRRGVERVYWLGLPVMPETGQTSQVKRLNQLFKAAAARHPDVVYVDTFGLLADKKGRFDPSVRSGDGVHFTNEGAQRIADAVWAAMKKDWQKPQQ